MKKRYWILGLVIIVLVSAFIGGRAWYSKQRAALAAQRLAEMTSVVEQEMGIHINHIGVTADGGLIDFRYTVIDPDKAFDLFEPEYLPVIVDEETGQELTLRRPDHEHEFEAGRSYYLIFRNVDNTLEAGNLITVKIGDYHLEHMVAQ